MSPSNGAEPWWHGVDLDLLADCMDGALPDAQARTVLDLVASDPAWAAGYAALASAQPAVRGAVASYAAGTEPMPADVADRITRALRDASRPAPVLSLAAARARRGRQMPGWARAAAGVAAACLVTVGAVAALHGVQGGSTKSASTTTDRNAISLPRATRTLPVAPGSSVWVSASGQDYTAATLGSNTHRPTSVTTFGSDSESGGRPLQVPEDLSRLTAVSALQECLAAITATYGGTPTAVDYATYNGQPALIVTISSPNLVVAVADQCGLPGAGAAGIASAIQR